MAAMDYETALNYLFSATDYEKMQRVRYNADTFSLDRMRRLIEMLGSPDQALKATVHVAGTKGKGSTAAMIHAVAMGCGLRAGLYTSPHLVDLRERIRVGRDDIAPADLARLISGAKLTIDRLRAAGDPPTFFEIFTALAFGHFAAVGVDLAVIETGLGGRLDATNILVPDVSVLTAISLDHTDQLGGTLASIAAEKAGIIKPSVPLVSEPQPPEALEIIEGVCREQRSPLVLIGRTVTYAWAPASEKGCLGSRVTVRTARATYSDLFIPLMGEHQAVNAAAALAAAERLGPIAGRLTLDLVRQALRKVRWPGRMEHVPGPPEMVLDGAHNRASMERLAEALPAHFPGRRRVLVFGAAADKDIDGMLAVLAETMGSERVVFTRTANPRAANPADLAARFAARGGQGAETSADVLAALKSAARWAARDGLVVVCGSLYLVGEVKALLARGPAR